MHNSSPRTEVVLSPALRDRLHAYVIAAGAGILTVAPAAQAKIVYTHSHAKIHPVHSFAFDLNHDGIKDFELADTFSTTSVGFYRAGVLSILAPTGGEIWGHRTGSGLHYASALQAGVKIGPKGAFSAGARSLAYGGREGTSVFCEGKWYDVHDRYLGLRFSIGSGIHYGWARLNVSCNRSRSGRIDAVLTGYAYETIAKKPIIAGKTEGQDVQTAPVDGLGGLAQGHSNLIIRRKKIQRK